MNKSMLLLALMGLLFGHQLSAQSIYIERGVKAKGLWCFPSLANPNIYYYLPNQARLAESSGAPEFSMLRYVKNTKGGAEQSEVVTTAEGGALLHFLVEYYTPSNAVAQTERALRQQLQNENLKLAGPLIFDAGKYVLISSILQSDGEKKNELLLSGEAPVLEGSKIAFSFHLSPEKSKLLMESLSTKTSDISVLFDLTFSGWSENYQAELTVNWSEVYQKSQSKTKVGIPFFKAEVDKLVEDMVKSNAITLKTFGADEQMDGLINVAYSKITGMLFDPVPPPAPKEEKTSLGTELLKVVNGIIQMKNKALASSGFNVGYHFKKIRKQGKTQINLSNSIEIERHHFITYNFGDLYQKYGQDNRFFKTVNLNDPDFQQRSVFVNLDGKVAHDFDKMLNNITVEVRKKHDNGALTFKQVLINRSNLEQQAPEIVYPNLQDQDSESWFQYEFRTIWNFKGGGVYQTPWAVANSATINLFAPYASRTIYLDGELQQCWDQGIRAIAVQINYPFFGKEEALAPHLLTPASTAADQQITLTIPDGPFEYDYQIQWITDDGQRVQRRGVDDLGFLLLDQLPN